MNGHGKRNEKKFLRQRLAPTSLRETKFLLLKVKFLKMSGKIACLLIKAYLCGALQ